MIYIYDILLNWTDTDKIYEFFEWERDDMIEHIKKIPLIKIDSNHLSCFMNNNIKVDVKFLEPLKNKSEAFCQKKVEKIEYACLLTDEKRVIAIEFDESGQSIYRSHLLLDEEIEILEISERLQEQDISYQTLSCYHPSFYLTRKEENMKKYLLRELKNTYQSHNDQKLHYLYSECFDDEEIEPKKMYEQFISSLKENFNEKHRRIYQLLKLSHTRKQV